MMQPLNSSRNQNLIKPLSIKHVCRDSGHMLLVERLIHLQCEVTDRLTYYLCGRKPGMFNLFVFLINLICSQHGLCMLNVRAIVVFVVFVIAAPYLNLVIPLISRTFFAFQENKWHIPKSSTINIITFCNQYYCDKIFH